MDSGVVHALVHMLVPYYYACVHVELLKRAPKVDFIISPLQTFHLRPHSYDVNDTNETFMALNAVCILVVPPTRMQPRLNGQMRNTIK